MSDLIELWETPTDARAMIVGWRQWADAGDVSSGLPEYLIELTSAQHIGRLNVDDCYLFQMPGGHHLMRPVVKLDEGHVESLEEHENDLFAATGDGAGFVIFVGDEPHLRVETYAQALLDVAEELEIERIVVLGGVYGAVPYDRDRDISCVYSLPRMRDELANYSVRFSNYEGGSTIGTYLAHRAEQRGIELVVFNALVPSYDFSEDSLTVQPIAVGEDYKAWHDVMLRVNHMFRLGLDLADLEGRSKELITAWDGKIRQLSQSMPQLNVDEYMEKVRAEFTERSFFPLDDVWVNGLRDLFDEGEDE